MMILALLLSIAGLPVIEQAATANTSDTFAVMLTGDGGWRPVDEEVCKRLRANGIPIAGFIASDYFRKRRTPEESARDLERVIRYYQAQWKKPNFILVGFSRGADSLPFMVSRLPPDLKPRLVALLGLESWIDFKFNPWWSPARYFSHEPRFDVLPEVEKLRGMNVMCVYGEKETDSVCPSLDPKAFTIVREPGGHHFAGRYAEVGDAIVAKMGAPASLPAPH
jgi:type IV secretory pathway VirJ component